jgi:hypothetical protein
MADDTIRPPEDPHPNWNARDYLVATFLGVQALGPQMTALVTSVNALCTDLTAFLTQIGPSLAVGSADEAAAQTLQTTVANTKAALDAIANPPAPPAP